MLFLLLRMPLGLAWTFPRGTRHGLRAARAAGGSQKLRAAGTGARRPSPGLGGCGSPPAATESSSLRAEPARRTAGHPSPVVGAAGWGAGFSKRTPPAPPYPRAASQITPGHKALRRPDSDSPPPPPPPETLSRAGVIPTPRPRAARPGPLHSRGQNCGRRSAKAAPCGRGALGAGEGLRDAGKSD